MNFYMTHTDSVFKEWMLHLTVPMKKKTISENNLCSWFFRSLMAIPNAKYAKFYKIFRIFDTWVYIFLSLTSSFVLLSYFHHFFPSSFLTLASSEPFSLLIFYFNILLIKHLLMICLPCHGIFMCSIILLSGILMHCIY